MSALFKVNDILNPQSEEDCYNELVDLLVDLNPESNITDFAVGSVMDSWIRTAAHIYYLGLQHSQFLMESQFTNGAANETLTKICEGTYDNKRIDAIPTQGYFRFYLNDITLGPYTISSQDSLIVKYVANDSIQYSPVESFTLDSNNRTKDVKVQCTISGTLGNINYGSTLQCQEIQGVSITNPLYSGSTWITQFGRDQENDSVLRTRSTTKFATYNQGETVQQKLINLVLNATGSDGNTIVSYASVNDLNPRGSGSVNVYIANNIDPVTQTQIDLIQSGTLDTNFFGNNSSVSEPRIKCYAASTVSLGTLISGSIGYSGNFDSIRSNVEASLDNFVSSIPIGGFTYDGLSSKGILFSDIESIILNVPGISNVVLNDNDEQILLISEGVKPIVPTGQSGQRWTKPSNNSGTQPFSWKYLKKR